jgi:hypothetical protein
MSYDGNSKPGNGVWSTSHEAEWDAVRRRPGNKTDRLQREPARDWHRNAIATKAVITIGREAAPTFFWGSQAARAKAEHR